jgi:hypothetical protein
VAHQSIAERDHLPHNFIGFGVPLVKSVSTTNEARKLAGSDCSWRKFIAAV